MELLAEMVDGRWRPGIGDPTFTGWLTVLAYFAAGALCLRRVAKPALQGDRAVGPRVFWLGLAICLLALGVNKQLDLQTWLTQVLRDAARAQGWYEQRRGYQIAGIAALAVSALVVLAGLLQWLHPWRRQLWLAMLGAAVLVVFVVVRAASFHHVDRLIGLSLLNLRLNAVFELGGILLIAAGALRRPALEPQTSTERHPPSSSAATGAER